MIPWLQPDTPFPPIDTALPRESEWNGLLAAGADLSPDRLISAYRAGVFPWYSGDQPILWWSPDPRTVLLVDEFKISRSLRKTLKHVADDPAASISFNRDFEQVMRTCATMSRDGQSGTWIGETMIDAYCALHRQGIAHSFEYWRNNRLIGGGYGIAIGKMFYGESMFAHETDASKVALSMLVAFLREQQVSLIDCQQRTRHLVSLGAREIPRVAFNQHIMAATGLPSIMCWPEVLDVGALVHALLDQQSIDD